MPNLLAAGPNLWSVGRTFGAICTKTNAIIKANGLAVMGAGNAREACVRYPGRRSRLGGLAALARQSCAVLWQGPSKPVLIAFPTKRNWRNPSDLGLIAQSCAQLRALLGGFTCLVPPPGISNGGLSWKTQVRPLFGG